MAIWSTRKVGLDNLRISQPLNFRGFDPSALVTKLTDPFSLQRLLTLNQSRSPPMVNRLKDSRKRRAAVVCRIRDTRDGWFSSLSSLTSSVIGLFQISVKLPHEPYKIQVMVGDTIEAR